MKKAKLILPLTLAPFVGLASQNQDKPNIVLIYADDIGYGDLSCYGATEIQTPNTDKLAESGIRFTNAHSAAATSTPSRYGLFTGEYPWRRKGTGVTNGDAAMIIKPEKYTLGKLMQEAGYKTGAVGKWHLGLSDKQGNQNWNGLITPGPKEIGFDYSFIMAATGDRVPCVYIENQRVVNLDPKDPIQVSYTKNFPGEPTGKDNPELLTKLKPSLNHGHDQSIVNGISRIGYMKGGKSALWVDEDIADTITAHAIQFIEENKDKPFFLYFGTNSIHVPRYPHKRFVGKSGMGLRGDAILEFDWSVGEVVKALEKAGVRENTIIIISSDNGPVVDDGYQDQSVENLRNHKPWGPFRGGKYSTFEAGTRVPFILNWANNVTPQKSDALVSQIDMLATFAEFLGIDISEKENIDSQPQLKAWLGEDKNGRDYVIGSAHSLTVLTKDWKYIEPNQGRAYNKLTDIEFGNNPKEQLYNMRYDRGEYENVADENKLILRFMKSILEEEKSKGVGMEL